MPRRPSTRRAPPSTPPASTCPSSSRARLPMPRDERCRARRWRPSGHSVRHARPITISLNCALGVKQLRPYVEELSRLADTNVGVYPNAGLPNAFGEYDEAPADTASVLGELAHHGHLNLVGGCCGTTPDHIRAIAERVRCEPVRRRRIARRAWNCPGSSFQSHPGHSLRERRRAHQCHGLGQVPQAHRGQRLPGGAVDRAPAGE